MSILHYFNARSLSKSENLFKDHQDSIPRMAVAISDSSTKIDLVEGWNTMVAVKGKRKCNVLQLLLAFCKG